MVGRSQHQPKTDKLKGMLRAYFYFYLNIVQGIEVMFSVVSIMFSVNIGPAVLGTCC